MTTLKSIINSEMSLLPYKFFDLDDAGKLKPELEKKSGLESKQLFSHKQVELDRARRKLGKEHFSALVALYLAQMNTKDGFDFERLEKDIQANKPVMDRHLGKIWMHHLKVVIRLHNELNPKPIKPTKGLLAKSKE